MSTYIDNITSETTLEDFAKACLGAFDVREDQEQIKERLDGLKREALALEQSMKRIDSLLDQIRAWSPPEPLRELHTIMSAQLRVGKTKLFEEYKLLCGELCDHSEKRNKIKDLCDKHANMRAVLDQHIAERNLRTR